MLNKMPARTLRKLLLGTFAGLLVAASPALAADENQQAPAVKTHSSNTYSEQEITMEAGTVFGGAAKGMADAVHTVFQKYGEPNAFIKGEEASGAIVLGLRYGSGTLHMKTGAQQKVFWQGPTAGWDFGG
ncbi:MAG TPA: EipA family protein, partial [Parvibaculum sp.]